MGRRLYIVVITATVYLGLLVVISLLDLLLDIEGPGQFIDFEHISTHIIIGLVAFYIAISQENSNNEAD